MSEFEKAFNQLSKVSLENHIELWGEPKTERAFFEAGQASKQAEIDGMKTQLNNMEACYIQVKKERDELLSRVTKAQGCFQDFYSTGYHVHIFEADEALRGEHETD